MIIVAAISVLIAVSWAYFKILCIAKDLFKVHRRHRIDDLKLLL